jgi:hypothetical protein
VGWKNKPQSIFSNQRGKYMKYAMLLFAVLLTTFGVVDTIQASQAANSSGQDSLVACRRSKDAQGEQRDGELSRT